MLTFRIPPQIRYLAENQIIFYLASESRSPVTVEIWPYWPINPFDSSRLTKDMMLDENTGNLVAGAYDTTDFIFVEAGDTYDFVKLEDAFDLHVVVCTYNGNKEFVDGVSGIFSDYQIPVIPGFDYIRYIRVSFANSAAGYDPANYAILKRGTNSPVHEPLYRFKGVYTPVETPAGFQVDISLSEVFMQCVPEKITAAGNVLCEEASFSFVEIPVVFKQDGTALEHTALVYVGGISNSFLRYLAGKNTNIFTYKLLNTYKQFLLTTRTAGRHLFVRESELCPFFFIATNKSYIIETEHGVAYPLPPLTPGNVYAFDLAYIRRQELASGALPSFFGIKVNGAVIFDVTIIPSAPVPNLYVIEFINSYGCPERLEVSGQKTSVPEIASDAAYEQYDALIDDYIERNDRLILREKINAAFGYKTLDELMFARDMLQSARRWIVMPDGSRAEVRVKSESYEHDLHPVTPGSVPLEISFADTETQYSPVPDESLPEGGLMPVIVTFHGNGGATAGGETTVQVEVIPGTLWKDVEKPSFFSSAIKKQYGYTFVQGDDNTVVEFDYIVTDDIDVYASYTVVEIGIVTHAGEIMKTQEWIDKYGTQSSPDFAYEYRNNRWYVGNYNNLIQACFFKAGDSAFAIPAVYSEGGVNYWGMILKQNFPYPNPNPNAKSRDFGGSDIDMSQHGFNITDSTKIAETPPVFPFLWNPPQYDIPHVPQNVRENLHLTDIDAKAYWNKLYELTRNHTDSFGVVGSPILEYVRNWEIPGLVEPGGFYIPSGKEMDIIYSVEEKVYDEIFDPLSTWLSNFPSGAWGESYDSFRWQYRAPNGSFMNGFAYFPFRRNCNPDLWETQKIIGCTLPVRHGELRRSDLTRVETYFMHNVYFNVFTSEVTVRDYDYNDIGLPCDLGPWERANWWYFVCDVSKAFE